MKRLFLILTALSIAFLSCNGGSKLKELVNEMKAVCPISMGNMGVIDGIEFDNNTIIMTYLLQDGVIDFNGVMANEESFRNNILLGYANNTDEGLKKFLEAIIEEGANLQLVFKNKSGEDVTLFFTSEELKKNSPGTDANPEVLLKTIADNARLQTPQLIDEGLVITDVTLDDNYLTYVYSCDESLYDIDFMNENDDLVRTEIITGFAFNDAIQNRLLVLLDQTNRELAYRYVGESSGKNCTFFVKPQDIFSRFRL